MTTRTFTYEDVRSARFGLDFWDDEDDRSVIIYRRRRGYEIHFFEIGEEFATERRVANIREAREVVNAWLAGCSVSTLAATA